jgi:hypothetical protein
MLGERPKLRSPTDVQRSRRAKTPSKSLPGSSALCALLSILNTVFACSLLLLCTLIDWFSVAFYFSCTKCFPPLHQAIEEPLPVPSRSMLDTAGLQKPFLPYFQPNLPLQGYLSASSQSTQPLCGNSEGWGPLSPIRYDFTPCFLDVWITAVSVGAIAGGAATIWYLLKHCVQQDVKRNWHFWAKLVSHGVLCE